MTAFWLDDSRNLVIYAGQPGVLTQYIPDLIVLSPTHFAVKRTLQNLIVLAHYNWPVPPVMIDSNYDWPIEPGKTPLPHQKVYANFTVLHPRMFNLGDPGCVDCDTEYLSPIGWRRIDQWDGGKVAQYHLDGHAEFVQPSAYVVRPCEWMYRLKTTRGVDQKLSAEHRVLYVDAEGRHQLTSAESIAVEAQRLKMGWRGRFITTFAGGQEGFELSDAQLKVMVAVIADGHFPNATNYCTINIKKQRKKERLRALLVEASISFREQKNLTWESAKGYSRFTFQAPRRDKEFDSYYWKASFSQLSVVCDEAKHWDGSVGQGERGPTFASVSKRSADFVQYAFTATGKTSRLSPCPSNRWSPGINVVTTRTHAALLGLTGTREGRKRATGIAIEPTSDGKKYCFEVPTTFLILRRNGQIFVTGNTMKTLSTLWALDFLMLNASQKFKALIVAPLTILETTWAKAIYRNFLDRRTFEILTGTPERRLKKLESDVDLYIVNHDGIKVGAHIRRKVDPRHPRQKRIELDGFSQALAARDDIKLVVIDEAHGFGDPSSARSGVANMLFGVGKRPALWQMTGTPNATAPTDAYGMAKLSNNAYGKSWTGFRLETMIKVSEFKWVPQKDGYDKARRILTPAIRFGLDEIWDGPPMTFQRRKVDLTQAQQVEMKRLKNELQVISASGHAISAANESAARQKLIQLSLGAIYDGDHVAHMIDATPRYRELEEIIESTERKVVVFVPITSAVHLVVKYLREAWKKKKVPWKCDFINGEVKAGKERDAVINNFVSDPDFRLVVADPQTATEGINEFVIADTVVWFGATDRSKAWIQGNARVRRPGQLYPSTCFQIISTKLEEEIFDRLENNTSMQGLMLDAIRKGAF